MSEMERYHIVKYGNDEPEHEMSTACFCRPVLHRSDIVTDAEVLVHKERSEMMQ